MTLQQKANLLRKWCIIPTTLAQSGHPTTCLSIADVMTVLFEKFYTYDLQNTKNLANDRLIFSKGHGAPLLYALYAGAGVYPFEDLRQLRTIKSRFEGHPSPEYEYTEAATGSLGQGLSIGAGMAYGLLHENKLEQKPHVFVVLGDGELAEGQNWEAANFASYYKLHNLIAIADINRLGQSQETMFGHHIDEYEKRFAAFGWKTISIDGHNFSEIEKAFEDATHNNTEKPTIILAKTIKGKGVSIWENLNNWHSKQLTEEQVTEALKELGNPKEEKIFDIKAPQATLVLSTKRSNVAVSLDYSLGQHVATKEPYGKALVQVAEKNENTYSLDGDVKNSTLAQDFANSFPEDYIECFIAEQNMFGVAIGLSHLGYMPFISTFSAFFTRAFDQIRMARVGSVTLHLVGSYVGVSVGKDGPSQEGLEDIAMIGALPDTTILYPADGVAAGKLLGIMPEVKGISYLRLSRPKAPIIYKNNEEFVVGGSKILRASDVDELTIVAAGITVNEALKAYDILEKEGIHIRVIDCYSVKPLDKTTLLLAASETKKKIIISVEDHFEHGGLGDFVLNAVHNEGVRVEKMAVTHISHSGTEEEVIADAGISALDIVKKVKSLL